LNYRHSYHAGNFGDVVKHAALALVIERLKAREKPFCVLDSHAGAGFYDLAGPAQKTGEYQTGILPLLKERRPPAPLAPYLALVRARNPGMKADGSDLRWYPGSPQIARDLMRAGDRLILVELHPEDAAILKERFAGDRQVAVHLGDGYHALRGLLPPEPRRGLVLIDPPFERKDEFARLLAGIKAAHKRWPTGHFLIWYPIKHRAPVRAFHAALKRCAMPGTLAAELLIRADDDPERLNGCGLVAVNPPWRLADDLDALLAWLVPRLKRGPGARRTLDWLVAERD
jgi:23S rRNA (adenine2030-N6)-methyltransferase